MATFEDKMTTANYFLARSELEFAAGNYSYAAHQLEKACGLLSEASEITQAGIARLASGGHDWQPEDDLAVCNYCSAATYDPASYSDRCEA